GAGADEDAVREKCRSVVSVRGASVRIIRVIAPLTYRWAVVTVVAVVVVAVITVIAGRGHCRADADAYTPGDLGMGARGGNRKGQEQEQGEQVSVDFLHGSSLCLPVEL